MILTSPMEIKAACIKLCNTFFSISLLWLYFWNEVESIVGDLRISFIQILPIMKQYNYVLPNAIYDSFLEANLVLCLSPELQNIKVPFNSQFCLISF